MVQRQRSEDSDPRLELEGNLRIDQDNLDECLVEQPGFFYHVAEEVANANARRDTLKLELEELMAEEDGKLRSAAARAEEKVTEASIQNHLRTLPTVQAAQRKYLAARTQSESWAALKEAYSQRSYMLKELVALYLANMHNLGVERGAISARGQLADAARARGEDQRREARLNKK